MIPLIPTVLVVSMIAVGCVAYAKRDKIKGRIKWLGVLMFLLSLAFIIKIAWALFDVASALFRDQFELALWSISGLFLIIAMAFYAGRYYQHRKHERVKKTKIATTLTTFKSKLTSVFRMAPIFNKRKV